MKKSGVCPKCAGQKVVHIRAVADSSSAATHHSGADAPTNAKLALRMEERKALLAGTYHAAVREGRLEAYACRDCGLVEHYLADPNELTVDGDDVREVKPQQPPYR